GCRKGRPDARGISRSSRPNCRSSDDSCRGERRDLLVVHAEVLLEDVPGMLAQAWCAPPGLDSDRVARDRPARIGNGAADLGMLDRAPVVAAPVVRDVVVLLGGV